MSASTPSTQLSENENEYEFKTITGSAITSELLETCSKLFNANYGVWGELASARVSVQCKRVRLPPARLRAECLSSPERTVLSSCVDRSSGTLVGHAFATVWKYDGGIVGWITQLVVDASHRRRGIATRLVRELKSHPLFSDVTAVGLASSHPASVRVLTKYSDVNLEDVDMDFIARNAERIFSTTPVSYLKLKEGGLLRGSLFQKEKCEAGAVCSVFTNFYIDHREPLGVLETFRKRGVWPFGELLEGHEFLVIVPVEKC
ncbi:hypothetical protein BDN70DRAFT_865310 [Pholiota conissans]|uniref:N-acetyltransferase domain-containing protein n=1 Tax=Pholiota conissans TaxID=109636 RepID=A0A9P5YTF0_9AGAR|nr:hypothetical protein BDN70DRAFT_865310 [Pholiota conissans]